MSCCRFCVVLFVLICLARAGSSAGLKTNATGLSPQFLDNEPYLGKPHRGNTTMSFDVASGDLITSPHHKQGRVISSVRLLIQVINGTVSLANRTIEGSREGVDNGYDGHDLGGPDSVLDSSDGTVDEEDEENDHADVEAETLMEQIQHISDESGEIVNVSLSSHRGVSTGNKSPSSERRKSRLTSTTNAAVLESDDHVVGKSIEHDGEEDETQEKEEADEDCDCDEDGNPLPYDGSSIDSEAKDSKRHRSRVELQYAVEDSEDDKEQSVQNEREREGQHISDGGVEMVNNSLSAERSESAGRKPSTERKKARMLSTTVAGVSERDDADVEKSYESGDDNEKSDDKDEYGSRDKQRARGSGDGKGDRGRKVAGGRRRKVSDGAADISAPHEKKGDGEEHDDQSDNDAHKAAGARKHKVASAKDGGPSVSRDKLDDEAEEDNESGADHRETNGHGDDHSDHAEDGTETTKSDGKNPVCFGAWTTWTDCKPINQTHSVRERARFKILSEADPVPEMNLQTQSCEESDLAVIPGLTSDWSGWSDCTKTCDGGLQMRFRSQIGPVRRGRPQELTETRPCGQKKCIRIVETPTFLGDWSAWSTCSRSCGGGIQSRYRKCLLVSSAQYTSYPDRPVRETVSIPKPRLIPRQHCITEDAPPTTGTDVMACSAVFCPRDLEALDQRYGEDLLSKIKATSPAPLNLLADIPPVQLIPLPQPISYPPPGNLMDNYVQQSVPAPSIQAPHVNLAPMPPPVIQMPVQYDQTPPSYGPPAAQPMSNPLAPSPPVLQMSVQPDQAPATYPSPTLLSNFPAGLLGGTQLKPASPQSPSGPPMLYQVAPRYLAATVAPLNIELARQYQEENQVDYNDYDERH